MYLSAVSARNFRCLQQYSIEPHPRLNFFVGANASGKTSFLESVFVLGRARSFRSVNGGELAGSTGRRWIVRGRGLALDPLMPPRTLRVEWDGQLTSQTINEQAVPRSELIETLPVQLIDPAQHRLLEDGPSYRRRYLDWGVFHVEPRFLGAWRRYERALRQRNRALKGGAPGPLVRAWDTELAESGQAVAAYRSRYLDALMPKLQTLLLELLGSDGWSVELQRGWKPDESLDSTLSRGLERDRRARQTVEGPHRAELRIRVNQHGVRNRISRGQQKMLVASLVLAQAALIELERGRPPVLLVDDFSAELGDEFQARLLDALLAYRGQLFITALQPAGMLPPSAHAQMFHVEQGEVRPG